MKIDLPIFYPHLNAFGRTVPAELVDVAPHLPNWTFALHQTPCSSGRLGPGWTVSNVETGTRIALAKTRKGALDGAIKRLASKNEYAVCEAAKKLPKEARA